jgi:hypothetical protein
MKGRVSALRATTQSIETRLKRSITMKGIPKPKFFSIISTKKSYDKGNLSKYFPELKKYY